MTKNLKIALISLAVLVGIYFFIQRGQLQYSSQSAQLFTVQADDVNRFLIQNKTDAIELTRQDSTWAISGNDTLVIKLRSIDKTILNYYAGLFIELKNSALFFVSFNFELMNSIASMVPIGAIIRLKTFIF